MPEGNSQQSIEGTNEREKKRNAITSLNNFLYVFNRCNPNESRDKSKAARNEMGSFQKSCCGLCIEKSLQEKLQSSFISETI